MDYNLVNYTIVNLYFFTGAFTAGFAAAFFIPLGHDFLQHGFPAFAQAHDLPHLQSLQFALAHLALALQHLALQHLASALAHLASALQHLASFCAHCLSHCSAFAHFLASFDS
jgi:hypothetical protein